MNERIMNYELGNLKFVIDSLVINYEKQFTTYSNKGIHHPRNGDFVG